jgi:hypothetical protein
MAVPMPAMIAAATMTLYIASSFALCPAVAKGMPFSF